MSSVAFTVYGQPAPAGSKTIARNAQGGQWIRDSSKKSYPWKQEVQQSAGIAMQGKPLLQGPLMLDLIFVVPRPKGHFGARGLRPSAPAFPTTKPDVLKLARAVEDAMSSIVFRDDAQIVTETLKKVYGEPARCEIRVEPVGEALVEEHVNQHVQLAQLRLAAHDERRTA